MKDPVDDYLSEKADFVALTVALEGGIFAKDY